MEKLNSGAGIVYSSRHMIKIPDEVILALEKFMSENKGSAGSTIQMNTKIHYATLKKILTEKQITLKVYNKLIAFLDNLNNHK